MAAVVGSSANAQRAYSIPPEKGVLITAPISGWRASAACAIDPSNGAQYRCINSGSVYQVITGGTTAASGGPSGSSANETDGTVHWKWIGFNQGQSVTTGSQIVAFVARGTQSTLPSGSAGIPPTDNQGGTFTTMGNFNYNGFTDSFCGVFFRSTPVQTTASYQVIAQFGGTSVGSGAGDEVSVGYMEIRNVPFGAPHTSSHTEIANSNASGVCQAATITTTKPCIIVSIWAGNGNVITPGQSHTAVPLGGLTMVSGCQGLVSLNNNGYIQVAVATRLATASLVPFAERWSTGASTGEGAQLFTLAFEDTTLTGNLATTLGGETLSAAGNATNIGSASFSFSADTLSAAGNATVIGSASIALAGDTVVGASPGSIIGSASIALGADTLSATGVITLFGSGSVTLSGETLSAAGNATNIGSASFSFSADTLSGAGNPTNVGSASLTVGADTLSGTGNATNIGSGSVVLSSDTLVSAGDIILQGSASITLAADTVSSAGGFTPVTGSAAITLADDSLVGFGGVPILSGSASIADGTDTLSGAGNVLLIGSASIGLASDTLSATSINSGVASITLANDTLVSAGVITLLGSASIQLGADSLTGAGFGATITGSANIIFASDTVEGGDGSRPPPLNRHVQELIFQTVDLPIGPGVPRTGGGGRRNPFRIK